MALADYTCWARYPIDPKEDLTTLSAAQKQIVYEYLTETLVACLEGHGHEIDDVPSRGTFMDNYDASPPWNPYAQVYGTLSSRAETESLEQACPPNTPAGELFGAP